MNMPAPCAGTEPTLPTTSSKARFRLPPNSRPRHRPSIPCCHSSRERSTQRVRKRSTTVDSVSPSAPPPASLLLFLVLRYPLVYVAQTATCGPNKQLLAEYVGHVTDEACRVRHETLDIYTSCQRCIFCGLGVWDTTKRWCIFPRHYVPVLPKAKRAPERRSRTLSVLFNRRPPGLGGIHTLS